MANYSYTAVTQKGKIKRGHAVANNPQELREYLRKEDIFLATQEEVKVIHKRASFKFKTKHLAVMCRQLSSMLNSGVPLVRAIHILTTQEEKSRAKKVLRGIYEDLQRGRSFSEALINRPGVFPDLFVSMVAAGESSGSLDVIMERVADHYLKDSKLNNKIRSAMVYPIILGGLMLIVMIVMFVVVLPTFVNMFPDQESIPPVTKILLAISDVMINQWYLLIGGLVIVIVAIRLLLQVREVRMLVDRAKCRLPRVGKLFMTIYTGRFARTMSNLFASGMQVVECIEKAVDTLHNSYIESRFTYVLAAVKRGEPISQSIAAEGLFEGIFTATIFIGEESGRLDEILRKSADFYDDEADSAVGRLVSMLEPLMIIFMGVGVALFLAGVFPAMYGSFSGIAA
jgi:type IV pilus assembly protein PilC